MVRALRIKERALGPNDDDVAETLTQASMFDGAIQDWKEAEAKLRRAVAIRDHNPRTPPQKLAWTLNSFAIFLMGDGRFEESREVFERTLAIREKVLGSESPAVASTLNPYGFLLQQLGDYTGARAVYERSLAIRQKTRGADHPDVARSMATLSSLMITIGDWAGARPLLERQLAIQQKAFGSVNLAVINTLYQLGSVYSELGDTTAARERVVRADSLRRLYQHELDPKSAESAVNSHIAANDLEGARQTAERSVASMEKEFGSESLRLLRALEQLAAVYRRSGDRQRAGKVLERARDIAERAYGSRDPNFARVESKRAVVLAELGETDRALDAALRAEEIGREHLRVTTRGLSERQALRYASVRISGLDLALSLAGHPDAIRKAWTAQIRTRATILDQIAARHRGVTGITRGAQALTEASQDLANLTVAGPGRLDPEAHHRALELARMRREEAERLLAQQSSALQQEESRARIGLEEVEQALPPGSVLVAYARYRYTPMVATTDLAPRGGSLPPAIDSYLALVLREGDPTPKLLRLGAASDVDSLVAAWGAEVSRPVGKLGRSVREARYRAVGAQLSRRIWDPVAPLVKGIERVFLVTDGSLDLVNLASLPAEADRYLVESGFLFHLLSAERDLVPPLLKSPSGSGMLAFGGPDFDHAPPGSLLATAATGGNPVKHAYRGERASCGDFRSLRFEALPAATSEARQVTSLWRAQSRMAEPGPVIERTGLLATKSAFLTEAPGRSLLHLATHAFFLGRCPSALPRSGKSGRFASGLEDELPSLAGDNPLLLSGLAFAGANRRFEGVAADDGIMTAEEIAAMDLTGVQWAVLSACETGVGQVQAGEGVFGLRRAFQIAGARTLIMSLWPVEDDATRRWMKALYEARWTQGLGTAEAMRTAELRLLGECRTRGESTHPFIWAPFVAVGDWR
ncbi:MAG: CHAT domain-containing tetratricopeptide repeat protein [Candidatus Eisenbacteria bacterium]